MASICFGSVALGRKGALPFTELDALAARRTSARLDELSRMRAQRAAGAKSLVSHLHRRVPSASPEQRRALIELQRALHNDRLPPPNLLALAKPLLSSEQRRLLEDWLCARGREEQLLAAAEAGAREELVQARRHLAHLAGREDVRCGLLLAGEHIAEHIERHVKDRRSTASATKAVRHAEATLVSYLSRMSLKTSPFGPFTHLFVHTIPHVDDANVPAPSSSRRSLVRLSRALLDWVERITTGLPECRDAVPLTLNNTVRVRHGKAEFLATGACGERFVRLPVSGSVATVLACLTDGAHLPRAAVIERLNAEGLSHEAAAALVEKLVEVDLLQPSLGLPEQASDYSLALVETVRRLPGGRAANIATLLDELRALEHGFAAHDADQRRHALAHVRQALDQIADIAGVERVSIEPRVSCLYEDVTRDVSAQTWNQALLEDEAPRFELLARLLPLFDQARIERMGLFALFSTHYGPDGRCDDVLEFYRLFAKQSPSTVSALMTGVGQPWAQAIFELRRAFAEHLREQLSEASGADVLHLDEAWLRRFVETFPEELEPWSSAAYGLQFFRRDPHGPGIVLNNVMPGHGWAYSRFCDLFDAPRGGRAALAALVRNRIRARLGDAQQADITAVFGMNTNLHPRLADLELVYPGCRGSGPPESQLTLRDIALVADPRRHAISLVSKHDGTPVRLVAHNFLFPAAGPNLYRFLCALSEFINYRGDLWAACLGGHDASATAQVFPRLMLGRLVLERRCWTWPTRTLVLPEREIDWRDPLGIQRTAQDWRRRLGLPRDGFFRLTPRRRMAAPSPDWVNEMRSWAIGARTARLRKPHYVRFDELFSFGVLQKQLRGPDDNIFSFRECLPSTDEYDDVTSAEEFYVEADVRLQPERKPTA